MFTMQAGALLLGSSQGFVFPPDTPPEYTVPFSVALGLLDGEGVLVSTPRQCMYRVCEERLVVHLRMMAGRGMTTRGYGQPGRLPAACNLALVTFPPSVTTPCVCAESAG